jgi:hypothetical protein
LVGVAALTLLDASIVRVSGGFKIFPATAVVVLAE